MEKKIKLSIIIPVFNVEKYVQTCLDSVIEQSFRDFEVIVVDDGSTDGSPAICDAAAKQDGRIRVIHQRNGGLSAARNAGLDIARGEWIGFLDSDDFILPDMYEKLMNAAEKARADIAVCNYMRVDVQEKPIEKQDQPIPDAVLNRDDILRRALRAPSMWHGIKFIGVVFLKRCAIRKESSTRICLPSQPYMTARSASPACRMRCICTA